MLHLVGCTLDMYFMMFAIRFEMDVHSNFDTTKSCDVC